VVDVWEVVAEVAHVAQMSLAARGLSPNRKEKDYKKEKESSKKEKNPEFRPLAAFLHSFVAQVAVLTQESSSA